MVNNRKTIQEFLALANLPGEDDGTRFTDPRRRNKIIEVMSQIQGVQLLHKDDYLLLYSTGIAASGDIILVSCHIDHVFKEKELFLKMDGENISGTLDNSGGIAALLYSLQEGGLPENVIISLTGGEESGYRGAEATCEFLENEKESLYDRLGLVVTIDMTPDNTEKELSLENLNIEEGDFESTGVRFNSVQDLKERVTRLLDGFKFGVIEDAEPDESHCYAERDLNTVSLCLPCVCADGDPHSTAGCSTKLHKIEMLAKAIRAVTALLNSGGSVKKEVTPQEFMVWAMKNKLWVTTQSRILIDEAVVDLHNRKLITEEEYGRYLALTKEWASKIFQEEE